MIPIFWYQNYVSMTLHLNFMMQNTRKIGPKMRPKVVIYDFSYHIMSILHHACFKVVLLNEAILFNHISGYSSAFFPNFTVIQTSLPSILVLKKAKNHVLENFQHRSPFKLIWMWFIGNVLNDTYLLVPKLCLSDVAFELYGAKHAKKWAKYEANGSYLRF